MTQRTLFIVDNNPSHGSQIRSWLSKEDYRVETFSNGELCLNQLDENPSAICMNIEPAAKGLDLLKRFRLANRDIPVVVLTDEKDLSAAVEAMKLGAFDYMVKPLDKIRLQTTVAKAVEMNTMVQKIASLQGELQQTYGYKNIVGQSLSMKQVFSHIEKVSQININVLILGESGTGKELVARAIHYNSSYKAGNFVAINCGAIPEALQESEFFGHEKGSFTGADQGRIGKLELAHGGTLFLDEVGEMPVNMQVKLLRFLQDKSYERVGSNKKNRVDLRVISATNKDLETEVERGAFRSDLFYRLMVYPILLPPLRERHDDIPLLVNHFLKKFQNQTKKHINTVTSHAMEALIRYPWPGNVRELENILYRTLVQTRTDAIQIEDLPFKIQEQRMGWNEDFPTPRHEMENASPATPNVSKNETQETSFKEIEKQAILHAIEQHHGKLPEAARSLGISRATIYRKMKQYRKTS